MAVDAEPPDVPLTVVGQINQGLLGIHKMLAMGLSAPEIELSEPESAALAETIANVGKYYVKVRTSNKMAAWMALVATVFMIYGPRYMALQRRVAEANTPRAPQAPVTDNG